MRTQWMMGAATAIAVAGVLCSTGVATAAEQSVLSQTCRTHTPVSGSSVTVCRTYDPNGDGTYDGTWKITAVSGSAVAQGRFDGNIRTLASHGAYFSVRSFVTRGCVGSVCTAFS